MSDTPLTRVSPQGDGYTVTAADLQADFDRLIPEPGRYDSVLVFADLRDEAAGDIVPMEAYGLSWGIQPSAKFATYAMIQYIEWDALLRRPALGQRGLFARMAPRPGGVLRGAPACRMPTDGLHGEEEHGMPEADPVWGWSPWYRQFLMGTAIEPDGAATGLGPRAWRLGDDPRLHRPLQPGFVTPALAARNLLRNGDAEASGLDPWRAYGWQPDGFAADRDAATARRGAGALRIRNTRPTTSACAQDVAVTPGHDYLLAGWIRTEGVRRLPGRRGRREPEPRVRLGTHPGRERHSGGWRYVALRFDARDRRGHDRRPARVLLQHRHGHRLVRRPAAARPGADPRGHRLIRIPFENGMMRASRKRDGLAARSRACPSPFRRRPRISPGKGRARSPRMTSEWQTLFGLMWETAARVRGPFEIAEVVPGGVPAPGPAARGRRAGAPLPAHGAGAAARGRAVLHRRGERRRPPARVRPRPGGPGRRPGRLPVRAVGAPDVAARHARAGVLSVSRVSRCSQAWRRIAAVPGLDRTALGRRSGSRRRPAAPPHEGQPAGHAGGIQVDRHRAQAPAREGPGERPADRR